MNDFIPAGTCMRFEGAPDVWYVQDCRPTQNGKSHLLRAINLAGKVIEQEILGSLKLGDLPAPIKKVDFFISQKMCPLCGADIQNSVSRFATQQLFWKLNVVECPECHLFFKEEFPKPNFLKHIYSQDYVHHGADGKVPDDSLLESRVRRMGIPCGRHLDYGCGSGLFVHAARHFGWDSYGADPFLPGVTVRDVPKDHLFRFDAALLDADTASKIGRFKCITLWAVLEHLTTPDATLSNLVSLLDSGGYLVFNAPNPRSVVARRDGSQWKLALLLEHLLFWSPACIAQIATRYGLKISRLSICGSPYPFGREAPSQTAQGLRQLPFECLVLPALQMATGSVPQVNSVSTAAGVSWRHSTSQFLQGHLGKNMSSGWADTLRKIINISRIGDHIEVVLQKT